MLHTEHDETRPARSYFARTLTVIFYGLVLTAAGANGGAHAQTVGAHYSQMAPLADYLDTDVEAEMALARSAAPAAISRDATVLVLKRSGYEVAQKGKNGFVCLVERAWMGPLEDADFWDPKLRGAICLHSLPPCL